MTNSNIDEKTTRESRNRKAKAYDQLMSKTPTTKDLLILKKEGDKHALKKEDAELNLKVGYAEKRLKSKRLIRKARALMKEEKGKDNG